MGSGSWSDKDWTAYSNTTRTKSVDAIYTTKGKAKSELDPKNIAIRESRDSIDNPNSTAIIVALDVTGSMGTIAENIAKSGLGTLFGEILDRKPVTDPHLMFMAVGDANCDRSPLQVSQFEADNRIIEQLTNIYLEGAGGGNNSESYHFPWYFAGMKTAIDCFEKRGKKGYLFTLGDELVPPPLTKSQIEQFTGDIVERDYTAAELLEMAKKQYNVFHIIIEQGGGCRGSVGPVTKAWKDLMGQNVISLNDYTKLSEVIVSTIQLMEGASKPSVVASWSGDTAITVQHAIKDLAVAPNVPKTGIIRF